MAKTGGWAGKVLRVDLSTGKIRTDDTVEKYKDYIGGTGIGYKVMWDEVAPGTKAFDPGNKIIFGTGPLAGTGAPCNGRTAITTLFPTCWPQPLVGTGHMGGQFAAELKYAGYDDVVIEGKADRPVGYLSIWTRRWRSRMRGASGARASDGRHRDLPADGTRGGCGRHRPSRRKLGPHVGRHELLFPLRRRCRRGDGIEESEGHRRPGTGSVRIAGDKGEWEKLVKYHLSLLGANNQHVVPSSPQPWAEYFNAGSRWKGSRGRAWGASSPPLKAGPAIPTI